MIFTEEVEVSETPTAQMCFPTVHSGVSLQGSCMQQPDLLFFSIYEHPIESRHLWVKCKFCCHSGDHLCYGN
jgi:hypothetical protein